MNLNFNGVTIIFNVADIERTRAFYRDHLGIQFERYDEEDGSAYLMTKIGQEVDLMVFKGDPKPGNTPNVVFGLADGGIDTLIERLASAGVEIVTPVSEAPGGWFADFRDPDGQIVSFYQAGEMPRALK
ncbi:MULTISPECIES: VOC family protein [Rhizobiaceae]|uniref:VOC family protein n=1 Tax=Rhizobiaceae TaxID=82115 RepID=UPI00083D1D54|nr:VOC family protein [Sinorhizobium sp. RAC02]AOF92109.1 glyoxalase-like domain protein [Sinorhizobium sp. RAC02]